MKVHQKKYIVNLSLVTFNFELAPSGRGDWTSGCPREFVIAPGNQTGDLSRPDRIFFVCQVSSMYPIAFSCFSRSKIDNYFKLISPMFCLCLMTTHQFRPYNLGLKSRIFTRISIACRKRMTKHISTVSRCPMNLNATGMGKRWIFHTVV